MEKRTGKLQKDERTNTNHWLFEIDLQRPKLLGLFLYKNLKKMNKTVPKFAYIVERDEVQVYKRYKIEVMPK